MRQVLFHDLGLIPYADAWALQTRLFQATIDRKLANRSLPENEQHPTEDSSANTRTCLPWARAASRATCC